MKKIPLSLALGLAFAVAAIAQTPTPTPTRNPPSNADNTARNSGDAKKDTATADKQPNNESDLKMVQAIRQGVISEKQLSMDAKNCKIIVANGMVTLRGPVDTAEEKQKVAEIAGSVAGREKVTDNLEVKAPRK